jgi:hypothetical protein
VLQVQAFQSEQHIPSGDYWLRNLVQRLREARFGILVLTPTNLYEPWMLFEAGALKLLENHPCCPVLFGVDKRALSEHPLSTLQCVTFEPEEFGRLVAEMGAVFKKSARDVDRRLNEKWPALAAAIADLMLEAEDPRVAPREKLPPTLQRLFTTWAAHRDLRASRLRARLPVFGRRVVG